MPQNISDGIRDKSIPDPILLPKQYATHLPLWFIFGKKGPSGRVVADGAVREQLFGAESFLASSKFFTHQTQYANSVTSKGNQGIYQRIYAENAKKAMMRVWLDVLPVNVPLYKRGTDGKYMLDATGSPIPTGTTTPGFQIKLVKTPINTQNGGEFGQASQMAGDQINAENAVQSTRFPFLDIPVSFVGQYGDDLGFRMWAPVQGSRVAVDTELLEDNKAYPYIFECLDRSSDTIQNIATVTGTQSMTAVMRRDQVKASVGDQAISFEPRFFEMYNDRERTGMAPLYGPFDEVHVYYDNLVTLLKQFYDAETPFIDQFSDFDGSGYSDSDDGEIHRFNFISGKSSKNVPYHSFIIDRSAANAEAFSDISTVWGEGGADGDMDLDTFDRLVAAEIRKYGSIENEVTENRLGNPESIFYDTGFGSEVKLDLANFIAVRKDTFLVWSLQDAQQARPLTADEESSLAIALFTRGQMLPESTEFATPACRFMIVACDGRLVGSTNRKRLPLSLEIATKSAEYMGAGNGLWKSAFSFSHGPRAEVSLFRDVNVTWRPIAARQRDWANGMVYVQKKDMEKLFFPGLRTGYSNERSILTSFFTVMVFVDLQKVADRVWAEFSGADQYSNEQFKKYVEAEFRRQTEGKYDGRVELRGTVSFTAVDEYNGFSWTLNVDVGADNMKTVQYTLLTGYRRESMPAAN
jgi:hypothetical protein